MWVNMTCSNHNADCANIMINIQIEKKSDIQIISKVKLLASGTHTHTDELHLGS